MSCKPIRRVPQCARCRTHNTLSRVRGHKRVCKWRDCTCPKCKTVDEKRRVTAVRVAVLRRERKRRISHKLSFENFQLGAGAIGAWGMMGSIPKNYTTEQLIDNRTILVQNDVFKNDMLHMVYPSMYRYGKEYLSRPGHVSSHGKEHQSNETTNGKQGDISNNLANFQHEYESLMRQQSEKDKQSKDTQPGNEISKLVPIHSFPSSHPNAPQRIFAPPTSTGFYISGPPVKHGEPFQSVLQQPQNLLPVMLNSPVTLPYPCPITPNHPIPYRVGF